MYKFNIASISMDYLNAKIDVFNQGRDYMPYIFMNVNTLEMLHKQTKPIYPFDNSSLKDKIEKGDSMYQVGCYQGSRIYINNDLDFGEIELR